MFTRLVQRKRPRRPVFLLLGGAVVAAGLFAVGVFAQVTGDGPGPCDVQVANGTLDKTCITEKKAIVEYIGDSSPDGSLGSSGTGVFVPFVRLQGSPSEQGYNTDGTTQFDTKTGTWTHAILVSGIPVVTIGTKHYWELWVDINDSNNAKHISLNKVEIYYAPEASGGKTITGYLNPGFPASYSATLEYGYSGQIQINDVNQGSGRGDLRYLVPLDDTGGTITIPTGCSYNPSSTTCHTYFVLYSQWGAAAGTTFASDGGFDEWKVKTYPVPPDIQVVKTPDSESTGAGTVTAGSNAVFTIVTTNNGPGTATSVTTTDNLPAGTSLDWSIDTDATGLCSITGPVGTEVLTCNYGDLASGVSRTVIVKATTSAGDCTLNGTTGDIENTATTSATNESSATLTNNSDHGDVNVQCPDIQVVKTPDSESTGAGTVTAGSNAVFTIVTTNNGPGTATSVTTTDNLPAGTSLDWSIDTDATGLCSITGPVGTEVLTCNYGDLASGVSRTVIVKATTSAGDCTLAGTVTGDIDNTATTSATNEDQSASAQLNNSDHGDVHVTCAAIQILKESTKTNNPLVTDPTPGDNTDNAVFTITPPSGPAFDVTDNGTGDENTTYGAVCVSGLAPGTYTVLEKTAPAGYGTGSAVDNTATAASGTDCGSNKPSKADSAVFTDPPLGEIGVTFKDLGSGETKASIVCVKGATTLSAVAENGAADPAFDDTNEKFTNLAPDTYTCTVVIDP